MEVQEGGVGIERAQIPIPCHSSVLADGSPMVRWTPEGYCKGLSVPYRLAVPGSQTIYGGCPGWCQDFRHPRSRGVSFLAPRSLF